MTTVTYPRGTGTSYTFIDWVDTTDASQPLWWICPRCGALNEMWRTRCRSCGWERWEDP